MNKKCCKLLLNVKRAKIVPEFITTSFPLQILVLNEAKKKMARKPFSMITPHQCRGKINRWSISLDSFDYSNVLGVGIFHLSLEISKHPVGRLDLDGFSVDLHFPYVVERHRERVNQNCPFDKFL